MLYKKYAVKELTFGVLHHHLKPGPHATSSLGSLFPSSVTIHKSVHGSHSESNVKKDTNIETQLEKNRVLVTLVYDTIPFSVSLSKTCNHCYGDREKDGLLTSTSSSYLGLY